MTSPKESSQLFNLEQYLSKLTLKPIIHGPYAPPMPPPKARSAMTPLTLQPGGYRRLKLMDSIMLDIKAAAYFSKMEGVSGEIIRDLQLGLQQDIAQTDGPFNPHMVNNAANVVNVLDRFLRRSIEALLGSIDDSMLGWTFQTVHRPRKKIWETQAVDPIVLCHCDPLGHRDAVKLVLIPLGPWEFAPRDFAEFTSMQRFDDTPSNPDDVWAPREWVNADRMWAYLYDLCLDFDCPYFAVTSHEQWSFGGFSQCYTTASVTRAVSFDNQPTSIAEMLIYWIHVAFDMDKAIPMTPAYSEKNVHLKTLQDERKIHAKRFLNSGLPGITTGSDNEEAPPAKRMRCDSNARDLVPKVVMGREVAVMIRRRTPKRTYWKLRRAAAARKQGKAKRKRDSSADSVISTDLSVAPSEAEPLPQRLIPRGKNAAIQRWRDLVAIIEEHGEVPQGTKETQGKWVDSLMYDPITGELTGDIEQIYDQTCPSCGPSSPTSSHGPPSPSEPAGLNKREPDFEGLIIHQWF